MSCWFLPPVPLSAKSGDIILAVLDGEFTVKRWCKRHDGHYLVAENKNFPPTKITAEMGFTIWGVVTHAVHSF